MSSAKAAACERCSTRHTHLVPATTVAEATWLGLGIRVRVRVRDRVRR